MMAQTIEYCLNNGTEATRDRLSGLEAATVIEKRCLQRCGECNRSSFLVVDGALETGTSHDDILRRLKVVDE